MGRVIACGTQRETGHEESEEEKTQRNIAGSRTRNVSLTACAITSTGSMTYTSLNKDQHARISTRRYCHSCSDSAMNRLLHNLAV